MTATTFNQAQYEAVISEIKAGLVTLAAKIAEIGPAISAATSRPLIPQAVTDWLRSCGDYLARIGSELLDTIKDLLEGAAAPIFFAIRAYRWQDTVAGPSSQVAATIAPNTLRACYTWRGDAATAYSRATASQTMAAAKIQSVGGTTGTTLAAVAGAGLLFYIALGVLLAKIITKIVAAIAGIGSGWFSWAGLLLIAETVTVDAAVVAGVKGTFITFIGAQAGALITLKGQVESNETFPSGQWPVGTV